MRAESTPIADIVFRKPDALDEVIAIYKQLNG